MNESKAMLELADRIERANDVTLDDGRLLPVREQRMIVASLRSSAPQGDGARKALEGIVALGGNTWIGIAQNIARNALSAPPSVAVEAGNAVIEEAESLNGHRMLTVRSDRGDEYVINADTAAKALAQLFSNIKNENRFGWMLNVGWYEQEISKLREVVTSSALTRPQPGGAVAAKLCSCKASERDGQHMAWCPSLSPGGAVAGTDHSSIGNKGE